jgi:tetratricopeptide (TPR) repeat protein
LAIDRAEILKKAEKLLRTGKLDLAIAEYVRLIEEQPRDWNTRNTLGDLYVRANKADEAVAQYTQIADHLFTEGFLPKAAALYKKILKIKPDEESVQLHLAEISATQGLLADAKAYFVTIAAKRRARGDADGANEITVRLGTLDPSDFDARALAARTLEQTGELISAAMQYRSMHADLLDKGRPAEAVAALREAVRLNPDDAAGRGELAKSAVAAGDLEAAKAYLDRSVAGDDPALLLALMEIELRSGNGDAARELLTELLRKDDTLRARIIDLAWTIAPATPEGAFVCIDAVVDAELAAGKYMDAAAMLQEFTTRVSGQIAALLKLVEICVDGGLEATMYETQAQLADAYLECGQGAEARVIAEDLVAREPWEHAHIDRFRRALVMLNVPDPDALIADRLSGQGPFIATDPFMAAESFGDPELPVLQSYDAEPRAPVGEPEPPARPEPEPERDPPTSEPPVREPDPERPPAREPEPDIPLRARVQPPAPEPDPAPTPAARKKKTIGVDIDLSDVLAQMQQAQPPAPARAAAPAQPQSLDDMFGERRSQVSRQAGAQEAAEQLALGKTYLEMGMTDEAIASLTIAAKVPTHRFEAASLLGRLYLKRRDAPRAVEWLERAAEAPAPTADEGHQLLFDLGATLEATGEVSRALAVFMELQADAGEFRDVSARVERLARVQTGG